MVYVDQNESTGKSLPSIVAAIRDLIQEPALDLFNEGLTEVGYLDTHKNIYVKTLYHLKEIISFKVAEGFPRVRRSQILDGVKQVNYQISIDACRPFRVEHGVVEEAVKNLKESIKNE